ncbi:MAG: S4 domain-containing protein [Rudaea sp.]
MTKRSSSEPAAKTSADIRLDVWLWATRFFKTRALAKKAIEGGHIDIDGKAARPSSAVRVADRMSIRRGDERFEIDVTGLMSRRGAPAVARANYRETEASLAARLAAAEQRKMQRDGYQKPPTKPDKRARRLIKALGDIDMI